jgi:hypothetical protein
MRVLQVHLALAHRLLSSRWATFATCSCPSKSIQFSNIWHPLAENASLVVAKPQENSLRQKTKWVFLISGKNNRRAGAFVALLAYRQIRSSATDPNKRTHFFLLGPVFAACFFGGPG